MAINNLYGRQYEDNILLGVQQLISKFREKCIVKTGVNGKSKAFGWIDSVDAREKTVRHADTIFDDPGHNRATAYLHYWYKSLMLDPDDQLKVIADAKSPYVQATLAAMRRRMDDTLIGALNGSKYTGENGTTETVFNTDYQVDADGSNILPIGKILAALEKFNDADVDENEEKFLAIGPKQLTGLLNQEKLTSADYRTLKALTPGMVSEPVLGFKIVLTTRLAKSGDDRQCLAWAKSGVGLAIGQDIKARVDEIQTKHYSFSTYASMFIGATRIEDAKVVRVLSDETKTS